MYVMFTTSCVLLVDMFASATQVINKNEPDDMEWMLYFMTCNLQGHGVSIPKASVNVHCHDFRYTSGVQD
jgi:hypothetical protein